VKTFIAMGIGLLKKKLPQQSEQGVINDQHIRNHFGVEE
jgi:hypothetical protein